MDLILWRHAEAEDSGPDRERSLTPKGMKQAKRMAQWLAPRLPEKTIVLASPAKRAQQTAQALTAKFAQIEEIGPGAAVAAVLAAAGWPDAEGAVVVVGHQPTLGQVAAYLLAGREEEWGIKKGGLWWLGTRGRSPGQQVMLRAVISPDLL